MRAIFVVMLVAAGDILVGNSGASAVPRDRTSVPVFQEAQATCPFGYCRVRICTPSGGCHFECRPGPPGEKACPH
jgi:hypothetical protein